MNVLEGLPATQSGGVSHRLLQGMLLGWLAVIACAVVGGLTGTVLLLVAGYAFPLMFVSHFVFVIVGATMQSRATRMVEDAERALWTDRASALGLAREALRVGPRGRGPAARAWLVIARCAEDMGDLSSARVALERALGYRQLDRSLLVTLHMHLAFVKAAIGELDAAERHLGFFGQIDLGDRALVAEEVRARALVLYKRGMFRAVVDLATEVHHTVALAPRDAALLAALEQSSLLRLGGGASPTRVAAFAPDDEPWLDQVLPGHRARMG